MTDQELLQRLQREEGYERCRLIFGMEAQHWFVQWRTGNGKWLHSICYRDVNGFLRICQGGAPQYGQPEQALPLCRLLLEL